MSDERELINTERGALERLTVNLTPRTQAAPRRAADRHGHSLTDTVNRAIQYYDAAPRSLVTPMPQGFWRQVLWWLGRR